MAGMITILLLVAIYAPVKAYGTALKRPCYEGDALAGRSDLWGIAGTGMWGERPTVQAPGSACILPAPV